MPSQNSAACEIIALKLLTSHFGDVRTESSDAKDAYLPYCFNLKLVVGQSRVKLGMLWAKSIF
jgi:hypothetical protein